MISKLTKQGSGGGGSDEFGGGWWGEGIKVEISHERGGDWIWRYRVGGPRSVQVQVDASRDPQGIGKLR